MRSFTHARARTQNIYPKQKLIYYTRAHSTGQRFECIDSSNSFNKSDFDTTPVVIICLTRPKICLKIADLVQTSVSSVFILFIRHKTKSYYKPCYTGTSKYCMCVRVCKIYYSLREYYTFGLFLLNTSRFWYHLFWTSCIIKKMCKVIYDYICLACLYVVLITKLDNLNIKWNNCF